MHLPSEERKQDREEWNEEPKRQNDYYAGIDEFYGREPITYGLGKKVVCRGSVTEKFLGERQRRRVAGGICDEGATLLWYGCVACTLRANVRLTGFPTKLTLDVWVLYYVEWSEGSGQT
jgi:hypothetical protein